jgi:hypothetical protein
MEFISDKALEERYVAGQPMRELTQKDMRGSLTYAVGHPIKNSLLSRGGPAYFAEFGNVAQALWALRGNPSFLGYPNRRELVMGDVLGINGEDEDAEELMRRYDGERAVSVGLTWRRDEQGSLLAVLGEGFVYIPPITGKVQQGLLTDIVQAYGRRAMEIPFDSRWLGEVRRECGEEDVRYWQSKIVRGTLSPLFVGGLIIPQISDSEMDAWIYWNPSKMGEDLRVRDERFKDIKPLGDKVGYVSDLLTEHNPEGYSRFQKVLGVED